MRKEGWQLKQEFKNNRWDYGVFFNGHHSTEFGLDALDKKVIGFPAKNKIIVQPPFSNAVLDFSNVYGGQHFGERIFSQTFNIIDRRLWDKESAYRMWTKVVNWLMSADTKQPLYDDIMKSYYYLAEVQKAPNFDEFRFRGELTVEWTCYPFRIYELPEGNDIWDTFDFELDIAQKTHFDVNGSMMCKLFNIGTPSINPTIHASSEMKIIKNNTQFIIPSGTSESHRFSLDVGENNFSLIGNGTVEFNWHKELI